MADASHMRRMTLYARSGEVWARRGNITATNRPTLMAVSVSTLADSVVAGGNRGVAYVLVMCLECVISVLIM